MSPGVWTGILLLLLANALYVAAEFGAVGVRRSNIRRLSEDGHRLARRLLPQLESPAALDRYVGASQIGITISSLALGAFAQATVSLALAPVVARWFGLDEATAFSVSVVVVLGTLTATQLVLGELVPKALALQYPTQTALATVLPLQWSLGLFRPFLALLNGTATLVLRLAGISPQPHRHLHSPEEIELMIAESRDGGLLEPAEQQRLHRALGLRRKLARDLMVPLDRLTMLPADAAWDDVVQTVSSSPYSRLPVYRGTRDRIVGTLRVKDLVDRYVVEGPVPLERLMRPVLRIAASLPADRIVGQFRSHRAHHAIVADEAGQAVGLVTVQDVLGELLGQAAEASPAR
ncbi:MAG: hemolysin family protein [Vicinamibacterales bacterium]